MMTTQITRKDGTYYQGKWERRDGVFVVTIPRVGGRGAEFVGSLVTARSQAGKLETVRVTGVHRDYGAGDCVEFLVER